MGGAGTALFQALGAVPPGVPTAPASTTSSSSARATSQPNRLPAAALRQTWVEKARPARAISPATASMRAAGTPLSRSANSGVYSAYSSRERRLEALEADRSVRPLVPQILLPVHPAPHEVAVPGAVAEQDVAHGQEHGGLGARPRRQPVVGHRRGVAEPRVHHADLGPGHLALDDALGVRVEVVAGLEVRGQHQDEARPGVVGRGAVEPVPERIAGPGRRRAHVGVAVVTVDAPCVEDALEIDELVPGPPEVIHDLLRPVLDEGPADTPGHVVEHLVPRDPLPAPPPRFPVRRKRVANPLRVIHLVEGRRTLGAVAAAAPGVRRIALELLDAQGLPVDVGE